jgi:hypothetical protein
MEIHSDGRKHCVAAAITADIIRARGSRFEVHSMTIGKNNFTDPQGY